MSSMRNATQKKRQLVMETALRMFTEKGYDQVSVDDIITATGTSKGTFYHYFSSKDDIVAELGRSQNEIIAKWNERGPTQVKSLEGHINRLFLDMCANIQAHPKLIRSLLTLTLQNESIQKQQMEQMRLLHDGLTRWLPDHKKVQLLISTYMGALLVWSISPDDTNLLFIMQEQLTGIWNGIRRSVEDEPFIVEEDPRYGTRQRVAIIGGGLAGLTAAAYLSESADVEGIMFERSPQLGGRAFTYEKSGFTLNYGAHAVYGIDRHTITRLEQELGLSFSSKSVDKRKVMYEKNNQIDEAPLDFINLIRTGLLSTLQKVRFVGEITAMIAQIHTIKNYDTLGDYLAESNADEDVKELWEHLVCSNFFIAPEDARKVSGQVISEYYQNLFLSKRPVNYILGSWAVITNQLRQKIKSTNRWQIALKEGVESIRYEDGKYWISTKVREEAFDQIIFAMPVQQVVKLMKSTPWEPFLVPYANNTSTEVMVYDLGLSRVVARPFSYISDMDHKMFISDVSATDHTLTPEGGQLLQGVAYIHDEGFDDENSRKAYLEERMSQMESLFDKHYPGWQDAVVVKRASKKAMVQSVKNISGNSMLPNRLENVPFYFCGDGCEGSGELAERSFSSARHVAQLLIKEATEEAAVN